MANNPFSVLADKSSIRTRLLMAFSLLLLLLLAVSSVALHRFNTLTDGLGKVRISHMAREHLLVTH